VIEYQIVSHHRVPPLREVLRPKFAVAFAIVGLVVVVYPSLPLVTLSILPGFDLEGPHHLVRAIAVVYVLSGGLVALQISLDHPAQPKHVLTVIVGSGVGIPLIYLLPYQGIPPLMFSTFAVLFPFAFGSVKSLKSVFASCLCVLALFGVAMYFSNTALALYAVPFAILFAIGLGLPLFFLGVYWAEIVPIRTQT